MAEGLGFEPRNTGIKIRGLRPTWRTPNWNLAEAVRFELTELFLVRRFSRPLQSAGLCHASQNLLAVTTGIEPVPFLLMREAHRPSMLRYHSLVPRRGNDPRTLALSRRCSTTELTRQWLRGQDSHLRSPAYETGEDDWTPLPRDCKVPGYHTTWPQTE